MEKEAGILEKRKMQKTGDGSEENEKQAEERSKELTKGPRERKMESDWCQSPLHLLH